MYLVRVEVYGPGTSRVCSILVLCGVQRRQFRAKPCVPSRILGLGFSDQPWASNPKPFNPTTIQLIAMAWF